MFCSNCGKELSDQPRYCPSCGKTVGVGGIARPNSSDEWEICEIEYQPRKVGRYLFIDEGWHTYFAFVATKYGPGGSKIEVARSSECKGVSHLSHGTNQPIETYATKEALRDVLTQLASDGWHYTNTGTHWYSNRLKRQVKR